MGLAEVVVALDKVRNGLQEARAAQVAGVVPAIEKARLYRGKGGEVMRSAVCRYSTALLHDCVHSSGMFGCMDATYLC